MKIRTGFVSNSSSSSFVLVGARLENEDEIKLALKEGLQVMFWSNDEMFIDFEDLDEDDQNVDFKKNEYWAALLYDTFGDCDGDMETEISFDKIKSKTVFDNKKIIIKTGSQLS